ncbi:nucleotidyltransferase domain-containing protein [Ruania alba]|uniref:Polymerase beta nucleotidyltransferase domain-containing protein n=1 Tax=Ruania alba TaxID=648782 RepID=A0A1H5BI52_9MICO|nr:nucleotidyltransferase domain-containing protein [Ruania alba]SED54046.1 hypothetical protein SAMN04488554_0109 [Ruania alba]
MGTGLVERLGGAAQEAFADSPVVFCYLIGSVARSIRSGDDPARGNDIDLAVHCGQAPYDLLDLLGRIGTVQHVADREVDLVVLDDAPLRLVARALRDRIVLYSDDEPARVRYEDLYGRMALDHALVAEPLDRELLAARARML